MANTINLNLRKLPKDVYLSIITKQADMNTDKVSKPNLSKVVAQIIREWQHLKTKDAPVTYRNSQVGNYTSDFIKDK